MLTSSVSGEGLFSETTPSEQQLIPGVLGAYPGCTPRPRNLPEYQAACRAAQGRPVAEYDACDVDPGMQIWHCGHFLTVDTANCKRVGDIVGLTFTSESARSHPFVVLRLEGDGTSGWLLAELDAPVYCLAPTPDACSAPGAGAVANESMAAGRG